MSSPERFRPNVPADVQADMEWISRAEHGTRTLYRLLAGRVADQELAQVLGEFQREQELQIDQLRRLLERVGVQAGKKLFARQLIARGLHLASFLGAQPLALRSCLETQSTLRHRYSCLGGWFQAEGKQDLARKCDELALTKTRQMNALQAWVRS